MQLIVIEACSLPGSTIGYGRDVDEAIAHAGFPVSARDFQFREVEVADEPGPQASHSATVAAAVCSFHIDQDPEVPETVKDELRRLIAARMFASAVVFCFDAVWDRGFEFDVPPGERKYIL